MPRTARVKSPDSIYHIMMSSVSDTLLFNSDKDKFKYLYYLKKYQDKYLFKVYSYCLMDNHIHLLIDAAGADISKFMHVTNQCYAQYFNKINKRRGHLFADRFKSKIIDTDRYLVTVSGYIHNNPSDIKGYEDCVEEYNFSSLGIYLGLKDNLMNIIDTSFVMQLFAKDSLNAALSYIDFVKKCDNEKIKKEIEFNNPQTEYRSERVIYERNSTPDEIVEYVSEHLEQNKEMVRSKYIKNKIALKALSIMLMRCFSDMTHREICAYMGNMTQSYSSKLSNIGYSIYKTDPGAKNIINNYINLKYNTS